MKRNEELTLNIFILHFPNNAIIQGEKTPSLEPVSILHYCRDMVVQHGGLSFKLLPVAEDFMFDTEL